MTLCSFPFILVKGSFFSLCCTTRLVNKVVCCVCVILRTVTGTVFLAHDDVVYYGKGVRTQGMKIVPIYGGSIFSTKY